MGVGRGIESDRKEDSWQMVLRVWLQHLSKFFSPLEGSGRREVCVCVCVCVCACMCACTWAHAGPALGLALISPLELVFNATKQSH